MFHEFGHYIVARATGIRVDEFAFGFGPKLIRLFKRGDTEYTIHPFPLGGFVKLAGMEPGEEDIPDGFQAQPIWKRSLVIFAGPVFSFLLAVLVFLFIGVYWGFPDLGNPQNRVGQVQPQTEAARIDLRAGDLILEINGKKITHGKQMTDIIHASAGKEIRILVERDGQKMTKIGHPKWMIEYLGANWSFAGGDGGVVDAIGQHTTASKAGIKEGDKLVSIDGTKIDNGQEMVNFIKANGSRPARLELTRNDKTVRVNVVPEVEWVKFGGVRWFFPDGVAVIDNTSKTNGIKQGDQLISINGDRVKTSAQMLSDIHEADAQFVSLSLKREGDNKPVMVEIPAGKEKITSGYYEAMGLLGFVPDPTLVKAGFGESVERGLSETWRMVVILVKTLTSKEIKTGVGGPVMIANVTKTAVALGPYWVFFTLGQLSLSLAVINLIPIPVFDGGHLAILGTEALRRKRLTREQMQVVQMVGLAIIGLLVVVVLFSDISKIVGGQVPQ